MAVLCRETQRAALAPKCRRTEWSRAALECRGALLPGMPPSRKDCGYPGGAPQAVTLQPQSRTVRGSTGCARCRAQLRETGGRHVPNVDVAAPPERGREVAPLTAETSGVRESSPSGPGNRCATQSRGLPVRGMPPLARRAVA